MTVDTYDPGQIYMHFATIPIVGFAEGTFITVERMSEAFISYSGAGGEVARVRMRDKRGNVKVTLMATSPVNDLLSAVALADETDGSGIGVLDIADGNGTTVINGSSSWIKKIPPVEFTKDLPTRQWEFEIKELNIFVGGNG